MSVLAFTVMNTLMDCSELPLGDKTTLLTLIDKHNSPSREPELARRILSSVCQYYESRGVLSELDKIVFQKLIDSGTKPSTAGVECSTPGTDLGTISSVLARLARYPVDGPDQFVAPRRIAPARGIASARTSQYEPYIPLANVRPPPGSTRPWNPPPQSPGVFSQIITPAEISKAGLTRGALVSVDNTKDAQTLLGDPPAPIASQRDDQTSKVATSSVSFPEQPPTQAGQLSKTDATKESTDKMDVDGEDLPGPGDPEPASSNNKSPFGTCEQLFTKSASPYATGHGSNEPVPAFGSQEKGPDPETLAQNYSVGCTIMKNMGWSPGTGLGPDSSGIKSPLRSDGQSTEEPAAVDKSGLGHEDCRDAEEESG